MPWNETKEVLQAGHQVERVNSSYVNNFSKTAHGHVSYARPHAQNTRNIDTPPDGREYPKQCFW